MKIRTTLLVGVTVVMATLLLVYDTGGGGHFSTEYKDREVNKEFLNHFLSSRGLIVNLSTEDAALLIRKVSLISNVSLEEIEELSLRGVVKVTTPHPTNNTNSTSNTQGNSRKLTSVGGEGKRVTQAVIDSTIDEIRIKLLEDISGLTYSSIMNRVLEGEPITSQPMPQPVKIVIVSTWRSGSTFLEELLSSHIAMFDFYEPLIMHKLNRVRGSDAAAEAEDILRSLLECRYNEPHYLQALNEVSDLVTRNVHLHQFCKSKKIGKELCSNRFFLSRACKLYPWKLMKLVRLKLSLMKPLLEDPIHSNLHVIYLVRDPRAVMNSRKVTVRWCNHDSDSCSSSASLCKDMDDDLKAALMFQNLFPNRVHILRYEDLIGDPFNVTQRILSVVGMDFSTEMKMFLAEHTTKELDRPWSTSRDSKKRLLFWTRTISEGDLEEVQSTCSDIMLRFGYVPVINVEKNLTVNDVLKPINLS